MVAEEHNHEVHVSAETQDAIKEWLQNERKRSLRGWLVLLPIGWFFVLRGSGISLDNVTFSLAEAWGLTIGTAVALVILGYAVRGWWIIVALPLWILLPMAVLVMWYWNSPSWYGPF